jgi:hypothetical protein
MTPVFRPRHLRIPPQAARPPRRRHDECKVAFKPPVRWKLPAKTHPRELPTNALRRLAPSSPSFPPTTSPAGCPRSGTSGLKATLPSPTPSTLARAYRTHEPRATLFQTRRPQTPPQAATEVLPCGRTDRTYEKTPTPKSSYVTRFPPLRERTPACVPCRGTLT